MRITIFIFALSALLFSCKKESLNNVDVIRFSFTNFAWGPQCERYELTPEYLKTTDAPCDSSQDPATVSYNVSMSAEKKALVEDLLHSIPEDFFSRPDNSPEQICCIDCGGYAIEVIGADGQSRKAYFEHILCDSSINEADKKLFEQVISAIQKVRN